MSAYSPSPYLAQIVTLEDSFGQLRIDPPT